MKERGERWREEGRDEGKRGEMEGRRDGGAVEAVLYIVQM